MNNICWSVHIIQTHRFQWLGYVVGKGFGWGASERTVSTSLWFKLSRWEMLWSLFWFSKYADLFCKVVKKLCGHFFCFAIFLTWRIIKCADRLGYAELFCKVVKK
jgi:hypothetical protein